jgi:hypothetical protein
MGGVGQPGAPAQTQMGAGGAQQQMNNNQSFQGQRQLKLPENIDLGQLANYQGEELKQYVGNTIYQTILSEFGDKHAPIITGTLLDENVVDFTQLLSNNEYFNSRVREAYALVASTQGPGPTAGEQA